MVKRKKEKDDGSQKENIQRTMVDMTGKCRIFFLLFNRWRHGNNSVNKRDKGRGKRTMIPGYPEQDRTKQDTARQHKTSHRTGTGGRHQDVFWLAAVVVVVVV